MGVRSGWGLCDRGPWCAGCSGCDFDRWDNRNNWTLREIEQFDAAVWMLAPFRALCVTEPKRGTL